MMAVHARPGNHSEWYTPPKYIEAAREVMGSIDFDPYSSEKANMIVKATTFNDIELPDEFQWVGNCWMNPPYSDYRGQGDDCVLEMTREFIHGYVDQAVILVNQSILYQPGCQMALKNGCICIVDHRIKFINGFTNEEQASPPQANAFIFLTPYGADEYRFAEIFSQFGAVLMRGS